MAMTSILYILGTICGIAVLFLLKFMQVVTRELHDSGTPRSCSALSEGNMFQKKENGVSIGMRPNLRNPARISAGSSRKTRARFICCHCVLTADPEKAEQCFVAGLDDSIHGTPVFKEWARSWSKRMIIKNAIRLIAPFLAKCLRDEAKSRGMPLMRRMVSLNLDH